MKKILLIGIASLFVISGCTNDNAAQDALISMGMSDVEMTGYRFFGCSKDDTFKTGFKARDARGRDITGVVCGGLMKGSTVRFD